MGGCRDDDPTHMSGGQQQRVAIAGMLAMDSKVLVLDEPTAMLDPQSRADVMQVLDALQARGTTIILVTHHTDELAGADRVIRLDHGRRRAIRRHRNPPEPAPKQPCRTVFEPARMNRRTSRPRCVGKHPSSRRMACHTGIPTPNRRCSNSST